MGFDSSKEIFIKGEQSVLLVNEITNEGHLLAVFLEMNALKAEFFDCESFITTIDDLVVTLVEAINYDSMIESVQNENGQDGDARKEKDK